jgi:thioredoxin-related protein
VYLLNFSFQNCLPCRVKKKYTPEIIERFKNQPFRLIEIHIFEEKKIFDGSYMLYYPYVYHDSLKRLTKLFGVTGGPTEFVFNKNGKAVRKHEGFDHDVAKNYVNQTTELIQKLLAE